MRREEVAFGSVADLTFRFRHNKACTVFSHLGAQRAIGNDSTTVPQIRKLILSRKFGVHLVPENYFVRIGELLRFFLNSLDSPVESHFESPLGLYFLLLVAPRHLICMVQGIPIGLTGMTVSLSESVKSEFRSNHTSQYTRPSNSLRGAEPSIEDRDYAKVEHHGNFTDFIISLDFATLNKNPE
ncbi:hypothetical protein HAX54_047740 [Datura stramonium]|uniref:Uncharacterized protein n=1 Tax=Datura stramonium TaxID=4076 RepID=A0ABS8SST8_DATST|nr:hypothetical protein [Datura stramonium]